jgi:hypothetical protein
VKSGSEDMTKTQALEADCGQCGKVSGSYGTMELYAGLPDDV